MSGYPFKPKALAWNAESKLLATSGDASITVWDFRGKGPEALRSSPSRNRQHVHQRSGNRRIVEITPEGKMVWRYGGLDTPGGFDVLPDGGLLIADYAEDRLFEIAAHDAQHP